MGITLSSLHYSCFGRPHNYKIVMVGVDAVGKTTALYKMKKYDVETVEVVSSTGFNVETVAYRDITLTIWDLAAQGVLRKLWHKYYDGAQAVIFVVDAADGDRMEEVRQLIVDVVDHDALRADAKILFLANKQDLPGCLDSTRLIQQLGLNEIKGKEWYVQPSNARTGEGLNEGLEWLYTVLSK